MPVPAEFEAWRQPPAAGEVRVIPIGGLGEFGMNALVVHLPGRIFLVDCGQLFPGEEQPGIDRIVPDFAYLEAFPDEVEAVLLTHGHEDHIGALPYFLRQWPVPVYGTAFTLALAAHKLREEGLDPDRHFEEVVDLDWLDLGGGVTAEWIPVTHSIPQACALALHTPEGTLLHSGDFKLDEDPIDGRRTGLDRLRELGNAGVRLLLSDSTNANRPGRAQGERACQEGLDRAFAATPGKLLVATFSSHIHRIQLLLDLATAHGRRVCLLGRSLERNVQTALGLRLLRPGPTRFVEPEEVPDLPPGEVLVLCTGSQGEPQSALARILRGEVKAVRLGPGDRLVLSARSIPGNEVPVSRTLDAAARLGTETEVESLGTLHVSGHGCREDLALFHQAVRPELFAPVHGSYRLLQAHAELVQGLGHPRERIFNLEGGTCLVLGPAGAARVAGTVPVGKCFVDEGVSHMVDARVVKDRLVLQEDGILFATFLVDAATGDLAAEPTVHSRGFVMPAEDAAYGELLQGVARRAYQEAPREVRRDREALREALRLALRRAVRKTTQTRPLVVPVILEV